MFVCGNDDIIMVDFCFVVLDHSLFSNEKKTPTNQSNRNKNKKKFRNWFIDLCLSLSISTFFSLNSFQFIFSVFYLFVVVFSLFLFCIWWSFCDEFDLWPLSAAGRLFVRSFVFFHILSNISYLSQKKKWEKKRKIHHKSLIVMMLIVIVMMIIIIVVIVLPPKIMIIYQ